MIAMRKIVVIALMAAACTPLEWSKPGAGTAQVAQDNDFCQREASREAPVHAQRLPPTATQGLYSAQSESGSQLIEASRLASFCMRSKGYALMSRDARSAATGDSAPE